MGTSQNRTDDTSMDELGLADRVTGWISDEAADVSTPEGPSKPCASCDDPHGRNQLVLTVEWEDRLAELHGIDPPDEECLVPLCTRCRSWAEMLEIAEMNRSKYGERDLRKVVDERDRFLESLSPELVGNFEVSARLEQYG